MRLVCAWLIAIMFSVGWTRSGFAEVQIQSRYSALLREKNLRADSLLPALDGDRAFAELVRRNPNLWSFERRDQMGDVLTRLRVDLVYIDGTREEQFCVLQKNSDGEQWTVSIGVDFVSGGSNTVETHVHQCLDYVRDELGYRVRKDNRVVEVPPRRVLREIEQSQIPRVLDVDLQTRVLRAHREVMFNGECPRDIDAYLILLEVWERVKDLPMDLVLLNDLLNPKRNGGKSVYSCSYSREWNQRYSERASMDCDVDRGLCVYKQSEDGTTRWRFDDQTQLLVYEPRRFWFVSWGGKSVRHGGAMLDLKMIPLSSALFLEAYLDEKRVPVALGLVSVGKH